MLWIHGGALVGGSSHWYAPKGAVRNLVSRGVVVVTIQYRLGLLGFFWTGSQDFPGNYGMLDQVEAMRWVKDEISNFGGDPNKITIFGESAGGGSVSAHTYSPLSRGLFQQMIAESGAVWTSLDHTSTDIAYLSASRAQVLCNFTKSMWNSGNFTKLHGCLMNMDYKTWLPLDQFNMIGWKIVLDNYFMPDYPRNLAKDRPNIPVIVGRLTPPNEPILGSNKDEWASFELTLIEQGLRNFSDFNFSVLLQDMHDLAGHLLPRDPNLGNLLRSIYANHGGNGSNYDDNLYWYKAITDVFTGAFFSAFMAREVDYYLANNNTNVYLYEFTGPSGLVDLTNVIGWNPIFHSLELGYIWMMESRWANIKPNSNSSDLMMADMFGEFWTNFSKYGTPSPNKTWTPTTNVNIKQYMDIGTNPLMRDGYRMVDQYVWNNVVPQLVGTWPVEGNITVESTSVASVLSSTDAGGPDTSFSIRNHVEFLNFLIFVILSLYFS